MKKLQLLSLLLVCSLISAAGTQPASTENPCAKCVTYPNDFWKILLISLPSLVFLYLLFYFLRWLKKEKFKLSDALSSDSSTDSFTTKTTKEDPTNPGKTITEERTEPNYARSSSRVIAFMTGLSAIVIAICLVTYYAYAYILQTTQPDFDGLWKIIASLGIGVVPYVSKIIKGENTTQQ